MLILFDTSFILYYNKKIIKKVYYFFYDFSFFIFCIFLNLRFGPFFVENTEFCIFAFFYLIKIYTSEDLKPHSKGAWFQIVTGNLVEELSAMRI